MIHKNQTIILATMTLISGGALAATNEVQATGKTQLAARSGTNIGNGSLNVDVTVNGQTNVTAEVSVKVSGFATKANRKGLQQWCSEKIGVIRDIREEAGFAKLSGADRLAIIQIYDNGFDRMNEGFGEFQGAYSLTQRAIVRGKEISEALGVSLVEGEKDLSTRVHFLETYYNFIERVAREVDIPYYIPYYNRGGCRDCETIGISEEAFAIKLLENARDQLTMVLDKMASISENGSIYPMGVPKGYLTTLEFAAKNAAYDLEESILYTRMACTIGELHGLGEKLARYNSGNGAAFGNRDDWAVRSTHMRATEQVQEIRRAIRSYATFNCDHRNHNAGNDRDDRRRDDRLIQPEPDRSRPYPLPPFVTPEGVQRR
jgi:hypothetical protein